MRNRRGLYAGLSFALGVTAACASSEFSGSSPSGQGLGSGSASSAAPAPTSPAPASPAPTSPGAASPGGAEAAPPPPGDPSATGGGSAGGATSAETAPPPPDDLLGGSGSDSAGACGGETSGFSFASAYDPAVRTLTLTAPGAATAFHVRYGEAAGELSLGEGPNAPVATVRCVDKLVVNGSDAADELYIDETTGRFVHVLSGGIEFLAKAGADLIHFRMGPSPTAELGTYRGWIPGQPETQDAMGFHSYTDPDVFTADSAFGPSSWPPENGILRYSGKRDGHVQDFLWDLIP